MLWQFPLQMLHLRNPLNPETQILWNNFKWNQHLNSNLYREIPENLSFSIWWISGITHFQFKVSYTVNVVRNTKMMITTTQILCVAEDISRKGVRTTCTAVCLLLCVCSLVQYVEVTIIYICFKYKCATHCNTCAHRNTLQHAATHSIHGYWMSRCFWSSYCVRDAWGEKEPGVLSFDILSFVLSFILLFFFSFFVSFRYYEVMLGFLFFSLSVLLFLSPLVAVCIAVRVVVCVAVCSMCWSVCCGVCRSVIWRGTQDWRGDATVCSSVLQYVQCVTVARGVLFRFATLLYSVFQYVAMCLCSVLLLLTACYGVLQRVAVARESLTWKSTCVSWLFTHLHLRNHYRGRVVTATGSIPATSAATTTATSAPATCVRTATTATINPTHSAAMITATGANTITAHSNHRVAKTRKMPSVAGHFSQKSH